MTTFLEASDITVGHFLTEWNAAGMPNTPVVLENVKQTNPDDISWVRFVLKQNEGWGQTLGRRGCRSFKRLGMILFQVFIPLYSATYEGNDLCEKIVKIFEGERVSGVSYYNGYYSSTGPSGDWFQFNGNIEMSFEEHK